MVFKGWGHDSNGSAHKALSSKLSTAKKKRKGNYEEKKANSNYSIISSFNYLSKAYYVPDLDVVRNKPDTISGHGYKLDTKQLN
jgi:hypothetical protein